MLSVHRYRCNVISIHAPARGATLNLYKKNHHIQFQSTLPRGERQCTPFFLLQCFTYFNPRSREGSDAFCSQQFAKLHFDFNPRSREGSDALHQCKAHNQQIFQSTLPRGERRISLMYFYVHRNFNPRSREGSDRQSPFYRNMGANFNPRSREGSDPTYFVSYVLDLYISIHAPARGATLSII